jgi:Transposase DDE domain group 1
MPRPAVRRVGPGLGRPYVLQRTGFSGRQASGKRREKPESVCQLVRGLPLPCRRFKDNAARLQLFALAYNLANFLRQLVLPRPIRGWTLTTLRGKLVKIGAKVVSHAKYLVFPLAEVAVPRPLFAALLERIGRLRLAEASG